LSPFDSGGSQVDVVKKHAAHVDSAEHDQQKEWQCKRELNHSLPMGCTTATAQ